MVMQIFYTPDITIKPELPEEEAGHCIRVLRLGEGDEIVLTDGQGSFYKAAISRAHPKHCEVTLLESWKQPDLWNFNLHIAIAPTKNMDRMEWFVEKATEIGINAITCLNCRFSERKEIKPIRLEKILVSAMKQSQKATLPALEGMTDFKKFVATPFDGRKFIAHCEEGDNPTIGILLCSETSQDIARFSILHDSKQLFASKYLTYLPTEQQLKEEIEKQKELFRLQHIR